MSPSPVPSGSLTSRFPLPSVGHVVNIKAKVNRAFNSSMEVCGRALPGVRVGLPPSPSSQLQPKHTELQRPGWGSRVLN